MILSAFNDNDYIFSGLIALTGIRQLSLVKKC